MREWKNPEIQELNVSATEKTLNNGTTLDFASYDGVTGEVIKSYFGSNESPSYGPIPDADLKPVI